MDDLSTAEAKAWMTKAWRDLETLTRTSVPNLDRQRLEEALCHWRQPRCSPILGAVARRPENPVG